MKVYTMTCTRCDSAYTTKASFEQAVDKLGSYCSKCKTGVIEVKLLFSRKGGDKGVSNE